MSMNHASKAAPSARDYMQATAVPMEQSLGSRTNEKIGVLESSITNLRIHTHELRGKLIGQYPQSASPKADKQMYDGFVPQLENRLDEMIAAVREAQEQLNAIDSSLFQG